MSRDRSREHYGRGYYCYRWFNGISRGHAHTVEPFQNICLWFLTIFQTKQFRSRDRSRERYGRGYDRYRGRDRWRRSRSRSRDRYRRHRSRSRDRSRERDRHRRHSPPRDTSKKSHEERTRIDKAKLREIAMYVIVICVNLQNFQFCKWNQIINLHFDWFAVHCW